MNLLFVTTYLVNGYSLFLFVLGCILGSFYNVIIYRLPEKTLLKSHRSRCRHCNSLVPFWLNIPILSWLLLLGKTRCCKKPLSIQYPIVELIGGLSMVGIYWLHPFINNISYNLIIDYDNLFRFLHLYIFFSLLLISSVIDFRLKIIPNVISFGMIMFSPIWIIIHPELDWFSSVLGIALGLSLPLSIALIYYLIRRKQGLGMGDVKILSAIGGWLGYQSIIPTLFSGSIIGAVVGIVGMIINRDKSSTYQIAFGPFLAFGAILYQITGTDIINLIIN